MPATVHPAVEYPRRWGLHALHAVLLASTVPMFLGALLSDIAYWRSHEIQWSNFASWLIVGGLVFGAVALVWALLLAVRAHAPKGRALWYFVLLLATWVLGFFNALVHARDAWASMPAGLVLSLIVAVLACAATAIGMAGSGTGARP